MPNFKPKANKKIKFTKKTKITLDNKHSEKMEEFKNIKKNVIPNDEKKIEELKNKFKSSKSIDEKLELKVQIKELKKKIKENKKKEKDYLLNNSKHIFNYFEKKKELSLGKSSVKKKVLHGFFDKNYNETKKEKSQFNQSLNSYLKNIDEKYIDIEKYKIKYDVCDKCSGELIPIESQGIMVCKSCSKQVKFLIEHEKPSYKEPPKEVCFYAYKRINHFREILAQFQAKETTQIPDKVLDDIKNQIKKKELI